MLFNSFEFIFAFLPLTLLIFLFIRKKDLKYALIFLSLASFFFYGFWNYKSLYLLTVSILINFYSGQALSAEDNKYRKTILNLNIFFNIGTLFYFKYKSFFLENLNYFLDIDTPVKKMVLPLAISFFTFTQLAYVVDCYKKKTNPSTFLEYVLFVLYFPHLIAGPIVHHEQLIPQFMKPRWTSISENVARGMTYFILGLSKKVILADNVALYANNLFNSVSGGMIPSFSESWIGALSYTFQLYFDFSGYSDMAIGASLLFGIDMPLNFNSPYKSQNITEFWRRWHMTLSQFLRDYLYIPLGGNRSGSARTKLNLFLTMFLGGIWHGAGWTFVVWGSLHGFYLLLHKSFLDILGNRKTPKWFVIPSTLFTFLLVIIAWVFFRASNFQTALVVLKGMFGFNQSVSLNAPSVELKSIIWLSILTLIAFFAPNTQEIMSYKKPLWRPVPVHAVITVICLFVSLYYMGFGEQEFLYFEF